jgi:hypothetical protein
MGFVQKFLALFVSPLCFLLLLCACTENAESVKKKALNEEHKFTITGCEIRYNGKTLEPGKPLSEWIAILGTNYRQGGAGRRYVWDDIGIYVNTDWSSDKVISLNIVFDNSTTSYFTLEELQALLEKHRRNNDKEHEEVVKRQIESEKHLISNTSKFNFKDSLLVDGVLIDGNVDFEEIKNQRWEYYKANKKTYDQLGIGFHTFNQSYTPERWEYNIPKCPNGRDFSAIFLMMEPGKAATLTFGS